MKKTIIALLVSASSFAMAADKFVIALAGPETGPVAQYGTIQKIGAEAAVKAINAQGGIHGKPIELRPYDDGCEPKQAVTVANQIVSDNVRFVVGHVCSSSTMPAAEIYNEEGILMVTATATSPELSEKNYSTIFRTIGTDLQSAPVSAKYIAEVLKPKKIALLHDKQSYGQGLAEAVEKSLKDYGITPVMVEGVNKGQNDFSALITRMKNEGIDFIYWGGYHPEAGLILRQGADQGFKPIFMGADGMDSPDLFAIAGDAAEGILATVPRDFSTLPENAAIVEAIKADGKDPSGSFVMPAYAAVKVIADAANKVDGEDAVEIAQALREGEYDTPIGKISFQKNGDLKDFQSVIYALHTDGSRTLKTE